MPKQICIEVNPYRRRDGTQVQGYRRCFEIEEQSQEQMAKINEISQKLYAAPTKNTTVDKNSQAVVDNLKSLPKEAEDGATLNVDGTKFEGTGLVVPLKSMNTTQAKLGTKMITDFAQRSPTSERFKLGLYKFPNEDTVSIDLNVLVDPKHKDVALEFARIAGQKSIFNLETFETTNSGESGSSPKNFSVKQLNEIAEALAKGELPKFLKR